MHPGVQIEKVRWKRWQGKKQWKSARKQWQWLQECPENGTIPLSEYVSLRGINVKEKVLFVNTCVRAESRTLGLARYFLGKLSDVEVEELRLDEAGLVPMSEEALAKRDQAGQTGDFSDPAYAPARALKDADTVVIAAPYWDLSFPASLKIFIENVLVTGLVFAYGADSIPHTLCKMKRVVYLTTSGGYIGDMNTGEVYIRQLCKNFLGDPQVDVVSAEGLDIWGNDVEGILTSAREKIDALF